MGGTVIVRVEVPWPPAISAMLAGFRDEVGPEGKTVADRLTVPTNPVLVTVIVAVADSPTSILEGRLGEETAKSLLTVRVTIVVCDSGPLLAVTVTR